MERNTAWLPCHKIPNKKQEWLCYIKRRTSQENKGRGECRVSPARHQLQSDGCSVKQSSVQGLQTLGLHPSHLQESGEKSLEAELWWKVKNKIKKKLREIFLK